MKVVMLPIVHKLFDDYNCRHICEIGTHKGKSAVQFVHYLGEKYKGQDKKFSYTGYDVFDEAVGNEEFNTHEVNGKDGAPYKLANRQLKFYAKRYPNLKYKLVKGLTSDTLVEGHEFDFVYIDGGHSYETVKHDYNCVKDSKVILFDDCQEPTVRKFTDELTNQGIDVKYIKTGTAHLWGLVVND